MRTAFLALLIGLAPLLACAQADHPVLNATFYDFSTRDYITIQETSKGPLVRYSNGVRPFIQLNLDSIAQQKCEFEWQRDSGDCREFYYIVSFPSSPTTQYKLIPHDGEFGSALLACRDRSGKSLNTYEKVTQWVYEQPSILSLFRSWGTGVFADSAAVITIERKEEPDFISVSMTSAGSTRKLKRISLHPDRNSIAFLDPVKSERLELRIHSWYFEGGIRGHGIELNAPNRESRWLPMTENR